VHLLDVDAHRLVISHRTDPEITAVRDAESKTGRRFNQARLARRILGEPERIRRRARVSR
jgi:hypothetical protein